MALSSKRAGGPVWVGRSIRRFEDPALVTGAGRFTGDLPAERWVRFVRSPVACGRIKRIAASAGATVLTCTDLADVKPIVPMLHKFNYVPIGQRVLAKDTVRFVGEPVAAVIADSPQEAEDLADLVELEIEEMPAVVGAREAIASGAPCVHSEAARNVIVEARLQTPGFDAAMARAHRLVEIAIRSGRQNALPLETRAAHAAWDHASGRVTLTCATQMPHAMRTIIAELIGMRESDLRVIAPDVGGGFGQKVSLCPEFVVITYEYVHASRTIHLKRAEHLDNIEFWMGDSRGHWDGHTLVVDVTDNNRDTWLDSSGNFHSAEMHVVERYTRTGPDTLEYEATIEDPKVLTKPFKISLALYRHTEKSAQLYEYECHVYREESGSANK